MRLNSIAEQTENRMGQLSHQSAQAHYLDLVEESACLKSALYYFQLLYESKTINNKFIISKKKKKKKWRVIGDLLKVSIAMYSSIFLIKLSKV